jgi:hypothetical protein
MRRVKTFGLVSFLSCIAAIFFVACGSEPGSTGDVDADGSPGNDNIDGSATNDASSSSLRDGSTATDGGSASDASPTHACPTVSSHVTLSAAGSGVVSAEHPATIIDDVNAKLLIATDDSTNDDLPGLYRCDLSGASCTFNDISADAGGKFPAIAIDSTNDKLLVVTENDRNGYRPALFRCNLDGTSCAFVDISANAGVNSGWGPSVAIDTANHKLLVATNDESNAGKPALFRCNLDGSSCARIDISATAAANSGEAPSLAIDTVNGKLLIATQDGSNGQKLALFRCNLDGTSCTYSDLSTGATLSPGTVLAPGNASGAGPSLAIDAANGKILIATAGEQLAMFQCALDGTSCVYYTAFPNGPSSTFAMAGLSPMLRIDAAHGDVLVATVDDSGGVGGWLLRCKLDLSVCSSSSLLQSNDYSTPSITIDPTCGTAFVTNPEPAVFIVP